MGTMKLSALFIAHVVLYGIVNGLTYTIDSSNGPLITVSESFISVALDTGLLGTVNLAHPNFSPLVKHLSPMYLRIGGTAADTVEFEEDQFHYLKYGAGVVIDSAFWLELAEFANNSNVRLLLDLNSLARNSDGSWNSANAEKLIKFSKKHDIDLDFELGNEPDLYQAIYQTSVSAEQLAKDYQNLRSLLDDSGYNTSYLVGPSMFDVGSNDNTKNYLKNFLQEAKSSIHAVTWHQYYFNGRDATEDLFLNTATFNYLEQRTKVVTDIVGQSNKVWLGETSSCYNQGAAGMSDRYLASFLWLDKLGLGAQLGLDVIVRQTIWGYNYPLLDADYNPNPDWWVSVLYKKLVDPRAVATTHDGDDSRKIRLYTHCAKPSDLWDNGIVVFGLNLEESDGSFSLEGFETTSDTGYLYEVTPEEDLYSQLVRLNGDVLNLSENLELPPLEPKTVDLGRSLTIAGHSLVFLVIPDTSVKACL